MRKIVTVVGLGVSGYGAALLLSRKGWAVKVTDENKSKEIEERVRRLRKEKNIRFEIGSHTRDFIKGSSLVIASPGARDDSAPIRWAREMRIPVIDEIELGFRYCPARIVAVTGTNGKSTTVTMIGDILKAGGLDAVVCGNIGVSFCEQVLNFSKATVSVLEVSSFELQRVDKFRPYIALILNITQNHLDRHEDFEEYLNAKLNIVKNQRPKDWLILNAEDAYLRNLYRRVKPKAIYFAKDGPGEGAWFQDGKIYASIGGGREISLPENGLSLKGEHNLKNSMAAMLVGLILSVKPEAIMGALKDFKGLEHRFEYVDEVEGVRFINDSKATTVDAALAAICSLKTQAILIAGGRDKGSDFTVLRGAIENRVKAVVLIGEARQKIRTQLLGTAPMYDARDLYDAVRKGFELATRSDTVLLSPMCASFDMFKNFEERGAAFKKAVRALRMHLPAPAHV